MIPYWSAKKSTMNQKLFLFIITSLFLFSSCESEADRIARETREEQHRIELEEKKKQEAEALALRLEEERKIEEVRLEKQRKEREARLEQERKEKAIYDKYINNSLRTGSTPYSYCYGGNRSCSDYGCSQIKVRTSTDSDVLVTIKKNDEVYRHGYIRAGSSYAFEFPNGEYQCFFYYGKGWNPKKVMTETSCGTLKGGFITSEHFGKDKPQQLSNSILEYQLILQQNGNFSTKPSNKNEAF